MAFGMHTALGLSALKVYATSMEIECEHLTLSDNVWVDHNGCIARRNWLPFQTSVYLEQLSLNSFDFGVGPALAAATAVGSGSPLV